MSKNQHVTPKGKKWQVKSEGSKKATKITDTQSEAINVARTIAKNQKSELIVHNKKGKIRQKDSYGNDPFPPKDKN